VIRKIVDIQVEIVKQRLEAKDIALKVSNDALDYLAKEGYNPQYGARPLKRMIQEKILNPVAHFMISKGVLSGGQVDVNMKGGVIDVVVKRKK